MLKINTTPPSLLQPLPLCLLNGLKASGCSETAFSSPPAPLHPPGYTNRSETGVIGWREVPEEGRPVELVCPPPPPPFSLLHQKQTPGKECVLTQAALLSALTAQSRAPCMRLFCVHIGGIHLQRAGLQLRISCECISATFALLFCSLLFSGTVIGHCKSI